MASKRKPTTKAKATVAADETDEIRKGKSTLARKAKAKKQKQPPPQMTAEEEKALLRLLALLETGFLATLADGVLEDIEFDNLGANLANWLEQDLTGEDLAEILDGFAAHLREDGFKGRMEYLASVLDHEGRRAAFSFAAMLVACDGEIADEELGMLSEIAAAYEIPKREAQKRFREIRDMVLSD